MSNSIVRALEELALRVGRTLSRDAGEAVEQMYRQAGRGVQDVVKRVSEADEHSGRKLVQIAERLGRNARQDSAADAQVAERAGLRARFAQILDPKGESAAVRAYQDAEIRVDSARYPETAQHIQEAQAGIIWRGDASMQGAPVGGCRIRAARRARSPASSSRIASVSPALGPCTAVWSKKRSGGCSHSTLQASAGVRTSARA